MNQTKFNEVSVLLQSGSVKTSSLRQQPPSKKSKTHFYGNCLQLGRETGNTSNRCIMCNEQEDNSVRLEDISKDTVLSDNILVLHLDNPLLFKPEIKEYKKEILISFMTTSYAIYFFSFPDPRFNEDYKNLSIFVGVDAYTLQNSYFYTATRFSNKHPSAFALVKRHMVAVGFEDGSGLIVSLNKVDKNNSSNDRKFIHPSTSFWFSTGPYPSKIVSINSLLSDEDDYVFCLEEGGKLVVYSCGTGKSVLYKSMEATTKGIGSELKPHSLRIAPHGYNHLFQALVLYTNGALIEAKVYSFNKLDRLSEFNMGEESHGVLQGSIIDCDLSEHLICVLTNENTKSFANFHLIQELKDNDWTRVEIKSQPFLAPSFDLIESNIDQYCLKVLFESGIFPRSVVYLALKRLFKYNNPEFFNMTETEQKEEIRERVHQQEYEGNIYSPNTKKMWKQYFDLCCHLNEAEPLAIYNITSKSKNTSSPLFSNSNHDENHVIVIKKHGISFIVEDLSNLAIQNDSFVQCLNAIDHAISVDNEFQFENHLKQALTDLSHDLLSRFAHDMATQYPLLLKMVQANSKDAQHRIIELMNQIDYVIPPIKTVTTGYYSSCDFLSIKNAIDKRYKLVRSILLFLHFQPEYLNTDPDQMQSIHDWLRLLYSYKWLFENANVKSSTGISLPCTIAKFFSCLEGEMNVGDVTLKNMRKGAVSLERQLLTDNHHYILNEFFKLSTKTANSYHNLGASNLIQGDFVAAKHLFTKASDNLQDGSLDDFLNEYDSTDKNPLIKYRIIVVLLWSKARKHDYVIDEAYLGLACAQDECSKALFFAQIFHHAISSEKYMEAYLVIISLEPGIERDTNLKRLIQVLCEKGKLETLVEFPYFGILGQVIEILLELARRSSVIDRPNYYEILYAFLIQRGDYTTAASTIYECATRLFKEHVARDMKPSAFSISNVSLLEVLNFRMDCLILSINSLSLAHSQYFIYRPPIRTSLYSSEEEEPSEPLVLDIDALKKEELIVYSLVSLLSNINVQFGNISNIAPDQMLFRLIENEYFDLAFTIACEFELSKSPIYAAIARILIQRANDTASGIVPRDTSLTWGYLKFLLEKFENVTPRYHHYAEFIEQILESSSMNPPEWMLVKYKESFYPTLQVTRGLKNRSLTSKSTPTGKDDMMVERV